MQTIFDFFPFVVGCSFFPQYIMVAARNRKGIAPNVIHENVEQVEVLPIFEELLSTVPVIQSSETTSKANMVVVVLVPNVLLKGKTTTMSSSFTISIGT